MKRTCLLLFVLFCLNLNAQKGDIYICSWNKTLKDVSEKQADKFLCNKKGKICYFISNNNDNIMLNLRVEDVIAQNRILKEGLIIWINMDGKQSKIMGVHFPVGSESNNGRGRNGIELPQTNSDGSMVTPLSLANSIELIGFTSESERRLPSENADSFNGLVKYDNNGVLLYRLVLPVSKIPIRNSKNSDGPMPFNIGLEYGTTMQAINNQRGSAPQSVPSSGTRPIGRSGSGGVRGGGIPGARGQGRNTSVNPQASKPSVMVWIKNIKLATGK